MQKVSCAISFYFGNRNSVHSKFMDDRLFYMKKNIEYIDKLSYKLHKIYFICIFENNEKDENILTNINEILKDRDNILISFRENLGGSYCSWKQALEIDSNDSDYLILMEDDYVLFEKDSIQEMLKFFKEEKLFYICQYWTKNTWGNIPEHAAMAAGMMNNKMYNHLKNMLQIDFKLDYCNGYECMCKNQAQFLETYRQNNILIMDWRNTHSSIFAQDKKDYGNSNGKKLIMPIIEDFIN